MMRFDYLSFRQLLRRLYTAQFEKTLTRYGLTQMEMNVLLFLYNHPGQDTAADFVNLCLCARSHASTSVDALCKMGYLMRRADQKDKKRVHLIISEAAEPLLQEGLRCQEHFFDLALNGISGAQRTALLDGIEKIRANASGELHQSGLKEDLI